MSHDNTKAPISKSIGCLVRFSRKFGRWTGLCAILGNQHIFPCVVMLRMWSFSFLLNVFEFDCAEIHRIVFACSAKPQKELLLLHLLVKIHGSLSTMSYSLHHKFILILGPYVHLIVESKVLKSEIQHYKPTIFQENDNGDQMHNHAIFIHKNQLSLYLVIFSRFFTNLCFMISLENVLWLALNGVRRFMWNSYFSAIKPLYTT